MRLADFDYELPAERIAQQPPAERDAARMLHLRRRDGSLEDRWFRELPELLREGDLLVVNDSRVLPARLYGRRLGVRAQPAPSPRNPAAAHYLRGRVEVLLLSELEPGVWEALVHPSRRLRLGERLVFDAAGQADGAEAVEAEVIDRGERGHRRLRFHWEGDFRARLERLGHVPLPPYIRRPDAASDRERYQTIFAQADGALPSAAAPTAGLHFSPATLERLRARGIRLAPVTLAVGLGTFQPVQVDDIRRHPMHAERYAVGEETAEALNRTRREGGRIIAAGTTAARTLETIAPEPGGAFRAGAGETRLFLHPGCTFRAIDGLVTNFHAPRTSLLMLVAAFAGTDAVRRAYRHALDSGYRFLSYGDCMLID